ncbi:MAG: hypothetical protein K6F29_00490 [Bacteroidales bacterium]|nr:hypothetical protein [Bacteroidales bacterium]
MAETFEFFFYHQIKTIVTAAVTSVNLSALFARRSSSSLLIALKKSYPYSNSVPPAHYFTNSMQDRRSQCGGENVLSAPSRVPKARY